MSGIQENSITVLEEESVLSMGVFLSLREEHFEKLLPKLTAGEHATLLKLWDAKHMSTSGEVYTYIYIIYIYRVKFCTNVYACRLVH